MNETVALIFTVFLWGLIVAIILRSVASWFPAMRSSPAMRIVYNVTEPILEPLRRIVPTIGMFDLTPLVALILLRLMIVVVNRVSS